MEPMERNSTKEPLISFCRQGEKASLQNAPEPSEDQFSPLKAALRAQTTYGRSYPHGIRAERFFFFLEETTAERNKYSTPLSN